MTSSTLPCDQRSTALLRCRPVLRKPSSPNRSASSPALVSFTANSTKETPRLFAFGVRGSPDASGNVAASCSSSRISERMPSIAGRGHRLHEIGERQVALAWKAAEMPAPGQDVEFELRRVRKLHQKDLVGRDRSDGAGRKCRRQRMEGVENDPDRGMVGAAHDLPGIAVVVDMPSPGERLKADAQAAPARPLAELVEIRGRPIDSAKRGRRDIAADQEKIGPKLLHQVEFALGARECARALRLGHALEIAKRLERAN